MDEDAVFRNVEFHGRCQFVGATLGDGAVFRRVRFSRGSRLARTTWGRRVSFDHATFEQQPSLADARFGDHASFAHTAWGPFANLANVQFGEKAMFRDATFANGAVIANGSFGSGAILRRASFGAGAILEGSRFASAACLDDAAFAEDANLSGTRFGRSSTLKGTRFGHDCSFADCSFEADADFSRATFRDRAHFLRGRFGGGSSFNDVTFGTEPKLIGCSFGPSVSFERLRCGEHAAFGATTFDRDASFEGATFKGDAQFIGSRFDEGGRIGPLSAGGAIELDGATISRPATIDIYASRVSCRRLRIDDGASFRLTAKSVDLSEVSFVKPTTVAPHVAGAKGSLAITSLRGSDTAALLLADVDLTSCSFVGAHNLDHLRIDGPLRLTRALRGRGRQTIADEQTWRAPGPDVSDPQTVAGLYRALRKAREDSKDAPGAADFYYGEMHMRRQALMATAKLTFHDRAELSILSLYWLLAGYGLRVWRPLLLLVGLVLLTGAAFATWGLPPRGCAEAPFAPAVSELRPLEQLRRSQIIEPREARSCRRAAAYSAGVLHSAESATSLLRSSARPLTDFGEVLQLFVRLAGPLLLAFAVLALRSRVQR
jgi:uncharacterized protein YjbI with pentapeptide repeats